MILERYGLEEKKPDDRLMNGYDMSTPEKELNAVGARNAFAILRSSESEGERE